jgi:hypothetical protein
MDPEDCIRELLDELNGYNEGTHLGTLKHLRSLLEGQKKSLSPVLKRRLTSVLRTTIAPFHRFVKLSVEAVYCLGTNVMWDRSQEVWLKNLLHDNTDTQKWSPVAEAIGIVFDAQTARRKNICRIFAEVRNRFAAQ